MPSKMSYVRNKGNQMWVINVRPARRIGIVLLQAAIMMVPFIFFETLLGSMSSRFLDSAGICSLALRNWVGA